MTSRVGHAKDCTALMHDGPQGGEEAPYFVAAFALSLSAGAHASKTSRHLSQAMVTSQQVM